jgi:hypothetical protein
MRYCILIPKKGGRAPAFLTLSRGTRPVQGWKKVSPETFFEGGGGTPPYLADKPAFQQFSFPEGRAKFDTILIVIPFIKTGGFFQQPFFFRQCKYSSVISAL